MLVDCSMRSADSGSAAYAQLLACASSASSDSGGRYKWGEEGVNDNVPVVSFGATTSRIGEKVWDTRKSYGF